MRNCVLALYIMTATPLLAEPAQGFFYEGMVAGYPEYWQELYYEQFVSAHKAVPLFADQVLQCWVTVSPIPEGSAEAALIDLNQAADGILFGTQWMGYDSFEAIMRQTNCR